MSTSTQNRYDAFSMTLHWLAAVAVVAAFALARESRLPIIVGSVHRPSSRREGFASSPSAGWTRRLPKAAPWEGCSAFSRVTMCPSSI